MVAKEVTHTLTEYSLRQCFSTAWTQDPLSVRAQARGFDYMTKRLKCLTAAAIDSASTLHCNYVIWCLCNLVAKSLGIWRSWRVTYKVPGRSHLVTKVSVTIQSWSEAQGRTVDLCEFRTSWAATNFPRRFSSYKNRSWDFRLAWACGLVGVSGWKKTTSEPWIRTCLFAGRTDMSLEIINGAPLKRSTTKSAMMRACSEVFVSLWQGEVGPSNNDEWWKPVYL